MRKLILAEPGGELDATLDPDFKPGPSPLLARFTASADKIAAGDIDGGLAVFVDTLEGPGAWQRLPAMMKQRLRDNATTLIGQVRDKRPPFSKADAEAIRMPTLFIGGANTKGLLPKVLHALAAHVTQFDDRDDPERHASDVRAGAAEILRDRAGFPGEAERMQTISVNGYDMAYLEVGNGPAAGLRARHARRFPHLVCGAGTAVEKASRHRGQPAALLSRSIGTASATTI